MRASTAQALGCRMPRSLRLARMRSDYTESGGTRWEVRSAVEIPSFWIDLADIWTAQKHRRGIHGIMEI